MKRSKFNLSHRLLGTGDFGYLYPILVEDVLPGDRFKVKSEVYLKAIPLLAPILDSVDIRVDYFFVPNRLLWSNWQNFITGGRDGSVNVPAPWFHPRTEYEPEKQIYRFDALSSHLYQIGLLFDDEYFRGDALSQMRFDVLPLCAYNKIYFDWYADENLENIPEPEDQNCPFFIHEGNYDIATGEVNDVWLHRNQPLSSPSNPLCLRQRSYRKDYLTSALPWPQRGPEVSIDTPPDDLVIRDLEGQVEVDRSTSIPSDTYKNLQVSSDGSLHVASGSSTTLTGSSYSDLGLQQGSLGSVSIPELRRLSAIQRWFERNARWGSRYVEQILSHFGVRTPDYRLDRAEYLGGTISPINVSETYQTAQGPQDQETVDVLGQYAGHLTSYGVNGMRKLRAEEHGWLIGLMSIVPRAAYGQGLQKRFTRFNRLDYAWPEFAGIGEQAVKREEVLVSPDYQRNQETFGYQRRFAEYMSRQDRFDLNMLNTFPFWHLGRVFDPIAQGNVLSEDFIKPMGTSYTKSQVNSDRIFAYTPNDAYTFDRFHFLYQINHHISAKRPIPKYMSPQIK